MNQKEKIISKALRDLQNLKRPHELVTNRLARRLKKKNKYAKIFKNLDYHNLRDKENGELDILALRGFYNGDRKYALIFEVKSSYKHESQKRAKSQLEKSVREIKAFYGPEVRCFKFYLYSSNNVIKRYEKGKEKSPYHITWIR